MLVCSCALPACQINGCQQAGLNKHFKTPFSMPVIPGPYNAPPTLSWKPVSEDDVRCIIQEELKKFSEKIFNSAKKASDSTSDPIV